MHALLFIVVALVAFFTMSWWMPHAWYRKLLYTGGRPNALSRRLNAAQAWVTSRGMTPALMVTLETRGRRTGKTSSVPLVVAELGGERYLVSMLGENADWVRNVRANGEAVLRYGKIEKVRLEEVAAAARAPILQAYLRRAPGGRPHFDIDMNAPLEEFARIAPRYPVFRVLPPA
ncbi:MAG TPA: nitroreductase family deazaflavin-dependent oxidoreductase [Candidatus Acidoferrales bacterium]|nr:nitroreductase family deazaflavin-dependent oxidoreductase [Candidatus Acidoferrales bacterium]